MKRTYLEKNWKAIEIGLITLLVVVTFLLSIKQLYPLDSFDEVEMMNWAKGLENDIFPALKFPPLFLYMQYILSWLYRLVLSFMGIISGTGGFLDSEFGFRFTMEAGRAVNAVIASFTVYMTYKIGNAFYNTGTAFAASLLTGLNGLVILYAHIFRPDIPVMCLLTLAVYFLLHYLHSAAARHLFLAAMFCGLAVAGKFNVFPVIPAIALAVIFKTKTKKEAVKPVFLVLPAGVLAGFFLGAPNWLFNFTGNIQKFFMQYSLDSGQIYQTYNLTSPIGTLADIIMDISHYFGPLFIVLLFLGVITGLILKRKQDITIAAMIIPYYLLFAVFGFYASRYGLPPYPLLALFTAKFLFMDAGLLLKKWVIKNRRGSFYEKAKKAVFISVCLVLTFWSGGQIIASIKNFNLLKTRLLFDATSQYREAHNILAPGINLGRQIYTPKVKGKNFKLTKRFYKKGTIWNRTQTIHFIQAHLPTYQAYMNDPKWQAEPRAMKLKAYRPFYRVQKRQYQPWNPEAVFLYPIRPELAALKAPKPPLLSNLPRLFYSEEHTTFLPLQNYQKNPFYHKIESDNNSVWWHWLYSTRPLKNIVFYVLSPRRDFSFRLSINGREQISKNLKGGIIHQLETGPLKAKAMFYDNVYRLEIDKSNAPIYLVFEPIYEHDTHNKTGIANLDEPLTGEIPPLFSNQPIPNWVQQYYVHSGIDLILLTYLNTVQLFTNSNQRTADITPAMFPLMRGQYLLHIEGSPIVTSQAVGEDGELVLTRWSSKGKQVQKYKINGSWPQDVTIQVSQPREFIKTSFTNLRQNNILIEQIKLIPEYHQMVNRR